MDTSKQYIEMNRQAQKYLDPRVEDICEGDTIFYDDNCENEKRKELILLVYDIIISLVINFRGYFLIRITSRGRYPGIYIYKHEYKFCTKCKKEKLLEEFHINKSSGDGKSSHCKKCRNKHNVEYRNTPERQIAGREYNKRYDSEYYHQHKAVIVESGKRSYKKHWARRKKYNEENYEKNKEKLIEYSKIYQVVNKERCREHSRKSHKKHWGMIHAKRFFRRVGLPIESIPFKLLKYKEKHILLKWALKSSQST